MKKESPTIIISIGIIIILIIITILLIIITNIVTIIFIMLRSICSKQLIRAVSFYNSLVC